MKKFQVHFNGHTAIDVDAKNEDKAREIAQKAMDQWMDSHNDRGIHWDIEMDEADDITEDEEDEEDEE